MGRLPGYLLGQDLGLQERVDGGQAAVFVAGPASADPVPFILNSCEEAERVSGRRGVPWQEGWLKDGGRELSLEGCLAGLSRNKGSALGGGSSGREGECPGPEPNAFSLD